MKRLILIIILSVAITITFSACNNSATSSTKVASKKADKEVYTCTMHPEIRSDKPGDCPKCGMKLVLMENADTTHMLNQTDTTHRR